MKLLIAGGGTGGHVFPAMAIAKEWMSRGTEREVVLVGTERGIEMKLVPQTGLPLETLRVAGLKGKGGATLLKNVAMLGPAIVDARRVLRKHKPVAAFGVGGYAAGPMLLATWLARVPNVIFEPNAEPGLTNKVLARISARIATGYEISARVWGKKAIVTGCPVRSEFFSIAPRKPEKPFRLLITGGSQGALPINRVFVDAMDSIATRKTELAIVHQTGTHCVRAARDQRGGSSFPHEHGGALCLGRRDCLPGRSHHRSGNRGLGPSRRLHPLRKSDGQPPIAQRAGNVSRGRRSPDYRGGAYGSKTDCRDFLISRPAPGDRKTVNCREPPGPPSCYTRHCELN